MDHGWKDRGTTVGVKVDSGGLSLALDFRGGYQSIGAAEGKQARDSRGDRALEGWGEAVLGPEWSRCRIA